MSGHVHHIPGEPPVLGCSCVMCTAARDVASVGQENLAEALRKWWLDLAAEEIEKVVPKAVEYSSTDLIDIGRAMARTMNRPTDSDAVAAELGIAFYALGKVSRIMGAIQEGRMPSDDSWHDLGIYARMAQRVRETGSWPR